MDTEATRALVKRFVEGWLAFDYDTVFELLAEDAEAHYAKSLPVQPVVGREAVARALTGDTAAKFIDTTTRTLTVRHIIADGDLAAVVQRVEATTLEGRPYENDYCWVYTCRDGKVAHLEAHVDTLRAARTFGWVKDS